MSNLTGQDSDELRRLLDLSLSELVLEGDNIALGEIEDYLIRRSRAIESSSSLDSQVPASPSQCTVAVDLLVKGADVLERVVSLVRAKATIRP